MRDGIAVSAVAPTSRARLTRLADDIYLTLHVAAMGFTLVLPLLGAAVANVSPEPGRVLTLLGIALSFHLFAYWFNDVVDLPLDRTEPLRRDDPLVRGAISPRTMVILAWLQLPVMTAIAIAGAIPVRASVTLAVAVGCLAAYDVWGKRVATPIVTDAVQGTGWAGLLLVGVPGDLPLSGPPLAAAGIVLLYVLLINGIVGPLRDLANDLARGARTTAILLGARPSGAGVRLSPTAASYAMLLHATVIAVGLLFLRGATPAAFLAGAVLATGATLLGEMARRTLTSPSQLALSGAGYIAASLGFVIVSVAHRADPALVAPLLTAFATPVGVMILRTCLVAR
ncbi:MAG: UbiA family prenyltransferase [Gemmatimonadaceae bacterium]